MDKKIDIKELREALVKIAWDANATREGVGPVLMVYPNDLLLELFGKEEMEKHWISDDKSSS